MKPQFLTDREAKNILKLADAADLEEITDEDRVKAGVPTAYLIQELEKRKGVSTLRLGGHTVILTVRVENID